MLNLKKTMAIAIIATFLSAIPLTLSVGYSELVWVTYTIEVDEYFAKPGGTPGGGGKPPTGYSLTGCKWKTLPLTLVMNPTGSGLSEAQVYEAIYLGSEEWDAWTGKEIVSSYQISSTAALDGPTVDKVNEIVFGPIADTNIIAQCTYWYYRTTRELVDFEIVFNTHYTWGNAAETPGVMDVQNIATHEIGHGFGLADLYKDDFSEQTMYGYGSAGETKKRTLELGDIAGIQKLYGA